MIDTRHSLASVVGGSQMAVEAVLGDVQFPTYEPLHIWLDEIPFQHLVPLFLPDKRFGLLGPERFGIGHAGGIIPLILLKSSDCPHLKGVSMLGTKRTE